MDKKIIGTAGAAAALGLSGAAVFAGELYKYTFRRGAGLLAPLLDKKKHAQDYYDARDAAAQRLRETAGVIEMSVINADGQALRGFYYPCGERAGKKLAFIVHGYRSEHAETAGLYLDYYRRRGFDLFCCDHAGHGQSEGNAIGWSITESRDCLRWLERLTQLLGSDAQIVLHGFSMGGASVLRMSDRLVPQVKFIVCDSGFSSARGILQPSLKRYYEPMRILNCLIGGYDIDDADVRPHLLRADRPILFVHGRLDPTVPFAMGEELYALCPTEKDCLFTDDARHVETMYLHRQEYEAALDRFIEKYIT